MKTRAKRIERKNGNSNNTAALMIVRFAYGVCSWFCVCDMATLLNITTACVSVTCVSAQPKLNIFFPKTKIIVFDVFAA